MQVFERLDSYLRMHRERLGPSRPGCAPELASHSRQMRAKLVPTTCPDAFLHGVSVVSSRASMAAAAEQQHVVDTRDALLHSQNRIRVLEDELAHITAQTPVEFAISSTFKLDATQTMEHVVLGISTATPTTQWLCDSQGATHVFHFMLSSSDGVALSAGLFSACPQRGRAAKLVIPAPILRQWEQRLQRVPTSSEMPSLYRPLTGRRSFIIQHCQLDGLGGTASTQLGGARLASAPPQHAHNATTRTRAEAVPAPQLPSKWKAWLPTFFGRRLSMHSTQRPEVSLKRSRGGGSSSSSRLSSATQPVPSRYLPALPSGRLPLRVCVRVEAFNAHFPDLLRTANFSLLEGGKGKPRLGQALGCSRMAVLAANVQPPIGCVDIAPMLEPGAAGAPLPATSSTAAGPVDAQVGVFDTFGLMPPPTSVSSTSPGDRAWSPRWVRVVGDSVTRGLMATNAIATALCLPKGVLRLVDAAPLSARKPAGPKWELSCNMLPRDPDQRWCISYEPYYDLPAAEYTTPAPAGRLIAGVGNATGGGNAIGRTLTYLSLGSHSKNLIGADRAAEARFFRWFDALLRSDVEPGSRVVLALETPRANYAAPGVFKGLGTDCLLSNMRIGLRNRAASRAFARACERRRHARCAVLDLFSSLLPYIFDNATFKHGDPVHPRPDRQAAWFLPPARRAFDEVRS